MKKNTDRTTPSAESAMKHRVKMGRAIARKNAQHLREQMKMPDRNWDLIQQLDYDPVRTERRIRVAANTFEMAWEMTAPVCTERPAMTEEAWMCSRLEEAEAYFPEDNQIYDELRRPPAVRRHHHLDCLLSYK